MQKMTHRITPELEELQNNCDDKCSLCGTKFIHACTIHEGYANDGTPIIVGDCCAHKLFETAIRTYWNETKYEVPEDSSILWRYMEFSKFISLLINKSIHFSRIDCLDDIFEGAKGTEHNKQKWDDFYLNFFRDAIRNPPEGSVINLTDEEIEERAKNNLKALSEFGEKARQEFYVSCWHESNNESESLWRLYCPPLSPGLVIQTTFENLKNCIYEPHIRIGRVNYIDYNKQFASINDNVFYKRQSLNHEKEVRAAIFRHDDSEKLGIHKPVNLSKLINKIVVSPFAPNWFQEVLESTVKQYEFTFDIKPSEMLLKPFY